MEFFIQELLPNVTFKTSRSGGKGGQNVNKVSSKVQVDYDFEASALLTAAQKDRIRQKLAARTNAEGHIQVTCEESRSQHLNKERSLEKLLALLKNALRVEKPRKATKPTKSSIEHRLKNKQQHAIKKLNRNHRKFDF